ncbi:restriction endonuclease PLD domain-containing protein [Edaphobacillus lindanitolerans]|uniref:NgoFVII restriction endonuclease n=1 Tax=Edaphobacillus lindanitolerans TaxID=550447 RepID=A0A1U7PQZ7_9BACI|nr:restriction endonuclease PLD domain-containing protein [Edaphobacillus lindanitolerans]SIT87314.1 NgoFVII restriction endonuclease [Edaphobacillus lindanitolerans]
MTVYETALKHAVLEQPYKKGRRRLSVLTGYASPPFIEDLLVNMPELQLEVVIGMARLDPITLWNHRQFKRLARENERLSIKYFVGDKPIHSKIYFWHPENGDPELVFVGSANLTRNGFINFREVLASVKMANPLDLINEDDLADCSSEVVINEVDFAYSSGGEKINVQRLKREIDGKPYVDLPLVRNSRGVRTVPEKSGLNWGQREGRDPDQAYIRVPAEVYSKADFFPPRGERFTVITDDGESFICIRAQENGKAIQTSESNKLMGLYFRKRLGLNSGERVRIDDIDRYGRDSVRIYKIDDETFYMDYYSD